MTVSCRRRGLESNARDATFILFQANCAMNAFRRMATGIRCSAAVGERLWLGLASGALRNLAA